MEWFHEMLKGIDRTADKAVGIAYDKKTKQHSCKIEVLSEGAKDYL